MEVSRRWAVSLSSDDAIDLKIARALFEIGDPHVGEIKVFTGRLETALFSDQFEAMSAALDVADASATIIDAINGICFVHDPDRSPLRCNAVHERLASGDWGGGTAFSTVTISAKVRVTAFAGVRDKDGNVRLPSPSRQSIWLQNAMKNDSALDILSYIRGTPDWFLLYKAYEAMRVDRGAARWPDTDRFTRSANVRRHFSGHPSAKQTPDKPFVPMDLAEATGFIRSLATLWFDSKFPGTKLLSQGVLQQVGCADSTSSVLGDPHPLPLPARGWGAGGAAL